MFLWTATAFILGAFFGAYLRRSPAEDIDLYNENKKLRKENEVLWARLKKEGKIKKF